MRSESKGGFVPTILFGIGTAVIIALVGVLVFAVVVKIFTLDNGVIKTVSQFIKVLSLFLGCMLSLRENKGLIKGALVGILATTVIYLLFSFIGSEVSFGSSFFIDLLFGLIVGGISGVIAVNLKNG